MEHDVRKPMTGALKPRKSTENPVHQRHDSRAISFVDFPIQSNPIQTKLEGGSSSGKKKFVEDAVI